MLWIGLITQVSAAQCKQELQNWAFRKGFRIISLNKYVDYSNSAYLVVKERFIFVCVCVCECTCVKLSDFVHVKDKNQSALGSSFLFTGQVQTHKLQCKLSHTVLSVIRILN